MADHFADNADRPLGHHHPLGLSRSLGGRLQRQSLGGRSLAVLDLSAFFPHGFPDLDEIPVDEVNSTSSPSTSQASEVGLQRSVADTERHDARKAEGWIDGRGGAIAETPAPQSSERASQTLIPLQVQPYSLSATSASSENTIPAIVNEGSLSRPTEAAPHSAQVSRKVELNEEKQSAIASQTTFSTPENVTFQPEVTSDSESLLPREQASNTTYPASTQSTSASSSLTASAHSVPDPIPTQFTPSSSNLTSSSHSVSTEDKSDASNQMQVSAPSEQILRKSESNTTQQNSSPTFPTSEELPPSRNQSRLPLNNEPTSPSIEQVSQNLVSGQSQSTPLSLQTSPTSSVQLSSSINELSLSSSIESTSYQPIQASSSMDELSSSSSVKSIPHQPTQASSVADEFSSSSSTEFKSHQSAQASSSVDEFSSSNSIESTSHQSIQATSPTAESNLSNSANSTSHQSAQLNLSTDKSSSSSSVKFTSHQSTQPSLPINESSLSSSVGSTSHPEEQIFRKTETSEIRSNLFSQTEPTSSDTAQLIDEKGIPPQAKSFSPESVPAQLIDQKGTSPQVNPFSPASEQISRVFNPNQSPPQSYTKPDDVTHSLGESTAFSTDASISPISDPASNIAGNQQTPSNLLSLPTSDTSGKTVYPANTSYLQNPRTFINSALEYISRTFNTKQSTPNSSSQTAPPETKSGDRSKNRVHETKNAESISSVFNQNSTTSSDISEQIQRTTDLSQSLPELPSLTTPAEVENALHSVEQHNQSGIAEITSPASDQEFSTAKQEQLLSPSPNSQSFDITPNTTPSTRENDSHFSAESITPAPELVSRVLDVSPSQPTSVPSPTTNTPFDPPHSASLNDVHNLTAEDEAKQYLQPTTDPSAGVSPQTISDTSTDISAIPEPRKLTSPATEQLSRVSDASSSVFNSINLIVPSSKQVNPSIDDNHQNLPVEISSSLPEEISRKPNSNLSPTSPILGSSQVPTDSSKSPLVEPIPILPEQNSRTYDPNPFLPNPSPTSTQYPTTESTNDSLEEIKLPLPVALTSSPEQIAKTPFSERSQDLVDSTLDLYSGISHPRNEDTTAINVESISSTSGDILRASEPHQAAPNSPPALFISSGDLVPQTEGNEISAIAESISTSSEQTSEQIFEDNYSSVGERIPTVESILSRIEQIQREIELSPSPSNLTTPSTILPFEDPVASINVSHSSSAEESISPISEQVFRSTELNSGLESASSPIVVHPENFSAPIDESSKFVTAESTTFVSEQTTEKSDPDNILDVSRTSPETLPLSQETVYSQGEIPLVAKSIALTSEQISRKSNSDSDLSGIINAPDRWMPSENRVHLEGSSTSNTTEFTQPLSQPISQTSNLDSVPSGANTYISPESRYIVGENSASNTVGAISPATEAISRKINPIEASLNSLNSSSNQSESTNHLTHEIESSTDVESLSFISELTSPSSISNQLSSSSASSTHETMTESVSIATTSIESVASPSEQIFRVYDSEQPSPNLQTYFKHSEGVSFNSASLSIGQPVADDRPTPSQVNTFNTSPPIEEAIALPPSTATDITPSTQLPLSATPLSLPTAQLSPITDIPELQASAKQPLSSIPVHSIEPQNIARSPQSTQQANTSATNTGTAPESSISATLHPFQSPPPLPDQNSPGQRYQAPELQRQLESPILEDAEFSPTSMQTPTGEVEASGVQRQEFRTEARSQEIERSQSLPDLSTGVGIERSQSFPNSFLDDAPTAQISELKVLRSTINAASTAPTNLLSGALQPISVLQSLTSEPLFRKRLSETVSEPITSNSANTILSPATGETSSSTTASTALPAQWNSLAELFTSEVTSPVGDTSKEIRTELSPTVTTRSIQPSANLIQSKASASHPSPAPHPRSRLSVPKKQQSVGSNPHLQAQSMPSHTLRQSHSQLIQANEDAAFTTITAEPNSSTSLQALEQLAQEIYCLLRQRLAVEQERHGRLYPKRFS